MEKHTENIVCKASENSYSQLDKNTVSAKNQLKDTQRVRFTNLGGKGKTVMFVGNSITLHGIAPQIGWNLECGMSASAKEKDYVHILMRDIDGIVPDSSYCICQASAWEVAYKDGASKYPLFEAAREFDADIIIMRVIENCPQADFDFDTFKRELGLLLDYLNKSQKAKIIMTTGFWNHPGDKMIREYAKEKNLPCIELGDLGEMDEMKAIGLFEHEGVANHPGDKGMKTIAERIFEEVKKIL